jgi:hypothetical protein
MPPAWVRSGFRRCSAHPLWVTLGSREVGGFPNSEFPPRPVHKAAHSRPPTYTRDVYTVRPRSPATAVDGTSNAKSPRRPGTRRLAAPARPGRWVWFLNGAVLGSGDRRVYVLLSSHPRQRVILRSGRPPSRSFIFCEARRRRRGKSIFDIWVVIMTLLQYDVSEPLQRGMRTVH